MSKIQLLLVLSVLLLPIKVNGQWYPELSSNLGIVNKIEKISYNELGAQRNEKEISWYKNGRIETKKIYDGEETIREFSYSYIEKKRNQEIQKKVIPANITMHTIKTFDKKGRLRKSKSYSSYRESSYYLQSNFEYDELGRTISLKEVSINGKDKSHGNCKVTYPDERTIKSETFKEGQKKLEWIICYDPETNTAIEETVSFEGTEEIGSRKNKMVGPKEIGWLIRDTIKQSGNMQIVNKRIIRFKYYYDDKGNWTEMYEVKKDGTEQLREKRKIDYELK